MTDYDPPPERPSRSDCCGSGCVPCVLDVYEEELGRWERRRGRGADDARLRRDLLSATEYKRFEIASVRPLCDDVRAFTFAAVPRDGRGGGRLPIAFTQHVHVQSDGVTRPYTPVALGDDCSFDVIVKAYPGGLFTRSLWTKRPGDALLVRGPSGVPVDRAGRESMVMFCGGTGVAAFLGLVRSALDDGACDVLLRLHYSCRTLGDVLMRDALTECAAYWNCAVFLYLTRERGDWTRLSESFRYHENVRKGRISPTVVGEIVDGQRGLRTLWLVCGPEEFNRFVCDSLKSHDVKDDCIRLFHNAGVKT